MPPDQVIQQLLEIIERQNELLKKLALSSQQDPYRDLKMWALGIVASLLIAFVSGYSSHLLEARGRKT